MMELPEPMAPADVDLRSMPYMPVFFDLLLKSDTWIQSAQVPYLGHVLINLWGNSWKQVPAGSLPNNDVILASFAMRTLSQWHKLKDLAMANWILCSDNRWYHPVVVGIAMDTWSKLVVRRKAAKRSNEIRWGRSARSADASRSQRETDPVSGDTGGDTPAAIVVQETEQAPLFDPQADKTTDTRTVYSEEFLELWAAYPRKENKGTAFCAWRKLKPNADLRREMMAAIVRQKDSVKWRKDDGEFIPTLERWIHARAWEDEESSANKPSVWRRLV